MAVSRRTEKIAGFMAASGLGILALAQILDIAGLAFWPQRLDPPGFPARLAAAVLLALGAYLIAGRAGLVRRLLLQGLYDAGVWIIAIFLLLRAMGNFSDLGLFRAERAGDWARLDIYLLSPLFLILGVACLVVAQGNGGDA